MTYNNLVTNHAIGLEGSRTPPCFRLAHITETAVMPVKAESGLAVKLSVRMAAQ